MSASQRKIGGDNNKRGNRYEDCFAVFRLIQFALRAIQDGSLVRLREQAGCPVDDLLLLAPEMAFYHQLKADKGITWGEADGKLEKEFLAQKQECEVAEVAFSLVMVIADEGRRKSLATNMPPALAAWTSVFLFPVLARPSDLVLHKELVGNLLGGLCAGRGPSVTEHQHLVRAFHAAWVDHEPDADGFCVVGSVIDKIREWGIGRLRQDWKDRPEAWAEAEKVLNAIPGLRWWVDRGWFEWEYPPTDRGLAPVPCTSDGLQRFIHRLIERRPQSFSEFERLLP